jgi:hypothetical protein
MVLRLRDGAGSVILQLVFLQTVLQSALAEAIFLAPRQG